jgi:S-adenosylmethionine-diacylglycerol 3-amino-3-carboxypropyl transferase
MFTQSWEDPVCDVRALALRAGERVFAITSGGDNVLALLLEDPGEILAVDLNPLQNFLLELKLAAFRRLEHPELLELLGVRSSPRGRRRLYHRVKSDLSPGARTFWDQKGDWFDRGLLTQGGFERYHAMLRSLIRTVLGRNRIETLFRLAASEQRRFYDTDWNTLPWRMLIRFGCSRMVMGRKLDPSWFADATVPNAGAHFGQLAEHAIADLPARTNYFLAHILRGSYLDEVEVPDYLRPGHFDTIRQRIDRIRPLTADVADALSELPDRSIDGFALSNVFEYSPSAVFDQARRELRRVARPNARLSLRNLLAPRRLADDPAFVVNAGLSRELQQADRGFIYSRFEAATVREGSG